MAWRSQIAWVPQLPYLFHASVLENIRLARPGASTAEVVAAARAAQADSFITALPGGYAAQIGERGVRLSGGQRQRLALARAFLRDAPVVILDEPTSQLDPTHAGAIYQAITELFRGRTVLLITHQLGLARAADRVVVFDDGRVSAEGRPADVLRRYAAEQGIVTSMGAAT
jgi:ATP-binding cassette subfamily B protein